MFSMLVSKVNKMQSSSHDKESPWNFFSLMAILLVSVYLECYYDPTMQDAIKRLFHVNPGHADHFIHQKLISFFVFYYLIISFIIIIINTFLHHCTM